MWSRAMFYLINGSIVFNGYGSTKKMIEDAFNYWLYVRNINKI